MTTRCFVMLLSLTGDISTRPRGGYDQFVNAKGHVVKACPDKSFIVSITGTTREWVTSLGPITCSDGSSVDLAPQIPTNTSSESVATNQNTIQGAADSGTTNSTAPARRDQQSTTSTTSSPDGFVAINMRSGWYIDWLQPVPAKGTASATFGTITGGGPRPQLQCPGGMVLGGLAVNWGGYADWGHPVELFDLPIQVGLVCRKVATEAYQV